MVAGIFGFTGMRNGNAPKQPESAYAIPYNDYIIIVYVAEVTQDIAGNSINEDDISYYFDIAYDKDFTNLYQVNIPQNAYSKKNGECLFSLPVGDYAKAYKDFYFRVRAVTENGASASKTINLYGQYKRELTSGQYGTICLPWASVKLEGADFYNVLGTKDAEKGIALTPITQLEAGKPYVFKATSDQMIVTYNLSTAVDNPVDAGNHIIGSFEGCNVPKDMYIIYQDLLYKSNGANTIGANRAYFDADNMEAYNPATAPARVVFMGGRQTPTGLEVQDARCTMHDGKYLINGQFVIIKDNKMYNAQGIEL